MSTKPLRDLELGSEPEKIITQQSAESTKNDAKGKKMIVIIAINLLTLALITIFSSKFFGENVLLSRWYWIAIFAITIIGISAWTEGNVSTKIAKKISIYFCAFAFLMTAITAICPGFNVKELKMQEQQQTPQPPPRDITWMTFKITPVKQDFFRVYTGDTIYYFATKGFWVEYEGGNKYFNNPSYNGQMMEFTITTANERGEIARVWSDETLQLKYRVKSRR
ncbi:hypothetical protein L6249_02840 [Candidatus Parcubacteria bacterium]|nr:hypothetical protein [Patescibacteria group bacterium]MCG2690977.1 hypothetical protein [Candidatus Parcubacteria bacterium]